MVLLSPGNFICLLVLTTADKKSSFNSLLVILAVADSFFLVFYLFDASYIDTFQDGPPLWYLQIFPLFLHPVKAMSMTACVYMVVAIAANRYSAICSPMLYR